MLRPAVKALCLLLYIATCSSQVPRSVVFINYSGSLVYLFWISPNSERVAQGVVVNGTDHSVNSFSGHTFGVAEYPQEKLDEICSEENGGVCKSAFFTVSEELGQEVYIRESLELDIKDHKSKAIDETKELLMNCSKSKSNAIEDSNMASCVESTVAAHIQNLNEEVSYMSELLHRVADQWEEYTCADDSLPTTPSQKRKMWTNPLDGDFYQIEVLHERPAAQIHFIPGFLSALECRALEKRALPRLEEVGVGDGTGTTMYDLDARRAAGAGIVIPWESKHNPITRVAERVYGYAETALGFPLSKEGQEDAIFLKYVGRGTEEPNPDRYRPHCDGKCSGRPHKPGTRIATMISYCKVPLVGGATNFKNVGVHIKPQEGDAVFFSYMDPETHTMDSGDSIHSGCPVIEGVKEIFTQWIRLGVSAERPAGHFNTLGDYVGPTNKQA